MRGSNPMPKDPRITSVSMPENLLRSGEELMAAMRQEKGELIGQVMGLKMRLRRIASLLETRGGVRDCEAWQIDEAYRLAMEIVVADEKED